MSKNFKYIIAVFSIFCLIAVSLPSTANAQYKGNYSSKKKKYKDKAARPIPRVFSTQVTSTREAEKLDAIYNELYISLWNYAITDFNYQKQLYALIEPQKFQITRYSKEFKGVLADSMENLNENSKNIDKDIENANKKYQKIREGIRSVDYEILDKLWPEKIKQFKKEAKHYLKMQYAFLKTYRGLVGFIIKQGGSYYFDTNEQRVKFYKFAGYKYFGETIDKLRRITYEQKKFLKENAPAGVEISTIKE